MQGRQDFRNFAAVWRHGFAIAILWIFLNYTGMCWQINPVYAVMHMIYGIGLVYLVTKGKFKGTWLMIMAAYCLNALWLGIMILQMVARTRFSAPKTINHPWEMMTLYIGILLMGTSTIVNSGVLVKTLANRLKKG